jgi:hypothetical protein
VASAGADPTVATRAIQFAPGSVCYEALSLTLLLFLANTLAVTNKPRIVYEVTEIDVPNGTSGSVGLPMSSNADSLTDNDRPVRKLEKLAAASASDDISGARPGYIYLENLGPGTHVVQVTGR